MFDKVLVANRGEIAVRILRACRELGLRSVAVYSEPDATALHARYADEALCIGAGPAAESYLNAEAIIAAAKQAGAVAIHPGYGFLSEQADFAAACAAAGIVFVGPPPDVLRSLGDKVAARRIARAAGAPTVPGTEATVSLDEALVAAETVGYPLLIKAAAGGGGKGIRLVDEPAALEPALRLATAEAQASFGDASVYLERYLDTVRHVEVQILADKQGNVIHLGERECSIQRRSQKLVEEAPSPSVDDALRERLGATAIAIVREAGYENVGTVEFLLDAAGNFYFIEVNARLQVEHPVTELVSGVDLVHEQLRIAAGEPLRLKQEDVRLNGWAVECRITSEDADRGFLPSLGRVDLLSEPAGPGVRVDSCLFPGAEISQFYDSLLAKVIAWGSDRADALARLRRALAEYEVAGIRTTIPFYRQLLADPAFAAGDFDTRFLERWSPPDDDAAANEDAALLIAAALSHAQRRNGARAAGGPPESSGWRLAARLAAARGAGGGSWRSTF